jgi:hypothetical protein
MITVAVTSPKTLERSLIRGHPPIDTSPRPSATGNLHSTRELTVGVGDGVSVAGVALGDGVIATTGRAIATPLLQTSFLPLLTHVYLRLEEILTWPCFLQAAPALTAPVAVEKLKVNAKQTVKATTRYRFMEAKVSFSPPTS